MRGRASPRLLPAAVVVAAALVLALVSSRPEPVAVAAPFALVLVLGLAGHRRVHVEGLVTNLPLVAQEGGEVTASATVTVVGAPSWVSVELHPPALLELAGGDLGTEVLALDGAPVELAATFACRTWGTTDPITASVVVHDRFRLVRSRTSLAGDAIHVRPSEERLRSLVEHRVLRRVPGSHLSGQRGDGTDFADIRPFVQGDRVRSVNWRASARRSELWVNVRHPDRSGDVVLFLDTFEAVGDGADGTLPRMVEAAVSLAAAHLRANDRVGLVDMGGVFRWVRPGGGSLQLHRIVDVLVGTRIHGTTVGKSIDVLPGRALPRRSLVIGLSPLLDARGLAALEDLRARSFDLVVVECSPVAHVAEGQGRRGEVARRLWLLERDAVRSELRGRGVTVVEWQPETPLEELVREVGAHRQATLRWAR